MSLELTGEIRRVEERSYEYNGQTIINYDVVVEPKKGPNFEIRLTRKNIDSGFHNQIPGLRGKVCKMPVNHNLKKGFLNWYYSSDKLPEIIETIQPKVDLKPVAKAS